MPKRRKRDAKFTTISISWTDKDKLRQYADFKKETKNGKLYESDSEVFHKMLTFYSNSHGTGQAHSTYPTLRDAHQRG